MENNVIPFTTEYLDIAADTFIDVFGNEPWNYNWITRDNIIRYFNDLYNTPCFRGFVLLEESGVMGFCLGVVSDYFIAPYYEIKEIFVGRQYQKLGYGRQLLLFAEQELAKQDVCAVTLFTENNIPAYDFYLRNGYAVSLHAVHLSKNIE